MYNILKSSGSLKQEVNCKISRFSYNFIYGKLVDDNNDKYVKEYVDTCYRYPTQVWKFKRDTLTSNLHPTQKPVSLLEELIKTFSNEGDIVLDNCMGSGSTGVACINTNRNFIGIELNEKYFNIATERINSNIKK